MTMDIETKPYINPNPTKNSQFVRHVDFLTSWPTLVLVNFSRKDSKATLSVYEYGQNYFHTTYETWQ